MPPSMDKLWPMNPADVRLCARMALLLMPLTSNKMSFGLDEIGHKFCDHRRFCGGGILRDADDLHT